MRRVDLIAVAGACLAAASVHLFAAASIEGQTPATEKRRVALTFDDLPAHGPLPPGMTRVDVARSLVAALQARQAPPVYGFINARQLESNPGDIDVLRTWMAAGFPLGNHAYSHMDLHANTAAAFEADVLANEATLRSLMSRMGDRAWRWFRYPYLREGDTPEKYKAVREMLVKHGYRTAQVTLDFSDYAYNAPYVRCLARNDREGLAWLEQSYMDRAAASLARGEENARAIFGRDISHVMLLHIGSFETVMLPRLLDLLEAKGFVLTTLEEAQADKAYDAVPARESNWSGTLLNQLRPRPPVSADAPKPQPADDVFAKLSALCAS
jgi:peptidoglycan/xylan/chitin deacetylase (PgdA/CDA1 family)